MIGWTKGCVSAKPAAEEGFAEGLRDSERHLHGREDMKEDDGLASPVI